MSAALFFEIAGEEDGGRLGLVLPAIHPHKPIGSLMPAADGDGTPGYAWTIEVAGLRGSGWDRTVLAVITEAIEFVELIAGVVLLDATEPPIFDPAARHGFTVAQPHPDTLTLYHAGRRVGAVFEMVLPIVGRCWRWRIEIPGSSPGTGRWLHSVKSDLPGALAAAWMAHQELRGLA